MITFYHLLPAWGLPSISPFCIKVETYLRMAGFEYRCVVGNPAKAPHGKLPYIEHDGKTVGDSNAIISTLEKNAATPLDAGLGTVDVEMATAVRGLLEDNFLYVLLWQRWCEEDGWKIYRPIIDAFNQEIGIPGLLRPPSRAMIRRRLQSSVWQQGIGRDAPDEVTAMGQRLLASVSESLGEKSFMLGNRPTTLDACVYGFLAETLWSPFPGPIQDYAAGCDNLRLFAERMRAQYWDGTSSA